MPLRASKAAEGAWSLWTGLLYSSSHHSFLKPGFLQVISNLEENWTRKRRSADSPTVLREPGKVGGWGGKMHTSGATTLRPPLPSLTLSFCLPLECFAKFRQLQIITQTRWLRLGETVPIMEFSIYWSISPWFCVAASFASPSVWITYS